MVCDCQARFPAEGEAHCGCAAFLDTRLPCHFFGSDFVAVILRCPLKCCSKIAMPLLFWREWWKVLCPHWATSASCAQAAKSGALGEEACEVVTTELLLPHSSDSRTRYRQLLPAALSEQPLSTARAGALPRLLCKENGRKEMEISAEERIMEHCLNKTCNSTCTEIPYEQSQTLLVAVYSIVFAIGLPANCLTSLLTFVQIQRNNVVAIYIFSLSLCDLMYLSTLPLWIIYVQNRHKWTMDDIYCKITGFVFFCNIYFSILLLCCISVDRYMALVYSLESRGRREQKLAITIVCVFFAMVAGVHTPVFFMEDSQNCTKTCFETVPLTTLLASFSFARFLLGFAIPFTILIFTNYKILQIIKRSSSLTCHQKTKVKYVAIAIIVIFLICFAPYHVVLIIRATYFLLHQDCPCPFENKIYPVFTVFLCLGTANGVADPIIYVLVSENIREDCYRSLRRFRRNSSKLNSSVDPNTKSRKLEIPLKESEERGQGEEKKEVTDSSDIQKTCTTGIDQESGS